MNFLTWAWRGAVLGLLLAIGYDTCRSTAALEGGRVHLAFGAVLGLGIAGAIAGIVVAGVLTAIEARPQRGPGPPPTAGS